MSYSTAVASAAPVTMRVTAAAQRAARWAGLDRADGERHRREDVGVPRVGQSFCVDAQFGVDVRGERVMAGQLLSRLGGRLHTGALGDVQTANSEARALGSPGVRPFPW